MYSQIPLGDSEVFVMPHTWVRKVLCSTSLNAAARTLGHPGAVPNTTFTRKLHGALTAAGQSFEQSERSRAVSDLAAMDANSSKKWCFPESCNVYEEIRGGIIKKSPKAFFAIMQRMPTVFPDEALSAPEFHELFKQIGREGVEARCWRR